MPDIISLSNQQVKDTVKLHQRKYRAQSGKFLLEGHKPIIEGFNAGITIEAVYTVEKNTQKFDFLKNKIITVTDSVLEKISTTDSMPEAVAVAIQQKFSIDDIKNLKKIALLENIKDGGNLGTVLRSAAAFGIEAVVLAGDTIDVCNPKVVRSAAGALFKLPVVKFDNLHELKNILKGHTFIGTVVNHNDIVTPEKIDYSAPFVILSGSEAYGLSKDAIEVCDILTTIPITDKTESLNLSVAASILFYISSCV